jgi:hypothetical protein
MLGVGVEFVVVGVAGAVVVDVVVMVALPCTKATLCFHQANDCFSGRGRGEVVGGGG